MIHKSSNTNLFRLKKIQYFCDEIAVFFRLRELSKLQFHDYAQRLTSEIGVSLQQFESNISTHHNVIQKLIFLSNKCIKILCRFSKIISLIPSYITQLLRIHQYYGHTKNAKGLIIAISSSRLAVPDEELSKKQYLSQLTKSFLNTNHQIDISSQINSSRHIFVCDPQTNSSFWKNKNDYWKENIFIIDENFLMFLMLISTPKNLLLCLKNIKHTINSYQLISSFTKANKLSLKSILVGILMADAYLRLFQHEQSINSYFFTSNSFSTEILRYSLLQSSDCKSVCEIMHGIPTIPYERYLADMLRAASAYDSYTKHSSISQIPNLPMFGVLKTDVKCSPDVAINLYLNKYLVASQQDISVFSEMLKKKLQVIDNAQNDVFIISFIGGTSDKKNFFESTLFMIECLMMQRVHDFLTKNNHKFVIFYMPHPSHKQKNLNNCQFFSNSNIIVEKDTIFSWFASDVSISLYSSALYEAAYFGVHAFSPTKVIDEIYPEVLLNLITYPKTESETTFVDELEEFIDLHVENSTQVEFTTKIQNRLGCLRHIFNDINTH